MTTTVICMPIVYLLALFLLGAGTSCPESEISTLIQPQNTQKLPTLSSMEEIFGSFTAVERAAVDYMGSGAPGLEPLMTKDEFDLFYEKISKADVYLEFGIGGSTTVAAARKNIRCMKSIESSVGWIDAVSKQPSVSAAIAEGRLELVHVDIGRTRGLGYPVAGADPAKLKNYSDQTFGKCGRQAQQRVVLVDGRFRVACVLKTLISVAAINPQEASATQIMMHDYERRHYHVVEDFADLIENAGTDACL